MIDYLKKEINYLIDIINTNILTPEKKEENIKEAIGILLYHHAYSDVRARQDLYEIFSTDTYGKKDIEIELLLNYIIFENPNFIAAISANVEADPPVS